MANDTTVSSTSSSTTSSSTTSETRERPPLTLGRLTHLFEDAVFRNTAKGQPLAQAIDRSKRWLEKLIAKLPEQQQGELRRQLEQFSWRDGKVSYEKAATRVTKRVEDPTPRDRALAPKEQRVPLGPPAPLTAHSISGLLTLGEDPFRLAGRMDSRIAAIRDPELRAELREVLHAVRPLPPPLRLEQVEASLRKDPSLRNVERLIAFIQQETRLSAQEKEPLFAAVVAHVEDHFRKGAEGLQEIETALAEASGWLAQRMDPPKPAPRREKAASKPPTPPRTGSAGFAARYGKNAQLPTAGGGGNQTLH